MKTISDHFWIIVFDIAILSAFLFSLTGCAAPTGGAPPSTQPALITPGDLVAIGVFGYLNQVKPVAEQQTEAKLIVAVATELQAAAANGVTLADLQTLENQVIAHNLGGTNGATAKFATTLILRKLKAQYGTGPVPLNLQPQVRAALLDAAGGAIDGASAFIG